MSSHDRSRLERRLGDALDELAPRPRSWLLDQAMAEVRATPQRGAWRGRARTLLVSTPAWARVTGGAMVVAALLVGIAIARPGPPVANGPSTSPVASGSSMPSQMGPAPSSVPSVMGLQYSWSQGVIPDPSPQVYGGEWPYGMAAFGGRYVAIGGINGGCCDGGFTTDTRAVVWQSAPDDPTSWGLVPDQASLALGRMTAVATGGGLLVAVGSVDRQLPTGEAEPGAAAWVSMEGLTWRRTTWDAGPLYDVAWNGTRFYAVGAEARGVSNDSTVWASSDGVRWSAAESVPALTDISLTKIDAVPGGDLVAAGTSSSGPAVLRRYAVAADGSFSSVSSAGLDGWIVHDVVGLPGGVAVAIGEDDTTSTAVVWHSDVQWAWAPWTVTGLEGATLERLITLADGTLVTAGEADLGGGPAMHVWASSDGSTWRLLDPVGGLAVGGQATDLFETPDGSIIVIGTAEGDAGHHGVPVVLLGVPAN